ncbi:DNA cytosine methyltransferase [Flexibacterium corallicola]|uniref:DNA cytosine methyltransferase n=1 Tax=Flexibacterium corallicola TaxID=3037259 RepID=UPI00286F1D28|nr:DNA cytosine methyltransferase [Pseudovibrio sp. M1P-2-3]
MNYYNEIDPYAAQWLRNLISEQLIPGGEVDERDIREVDPDRLRGFHQCHFFAGIGGWSYALQLAGWPEERSVWTGSCPCQPFSTAGKGKGTKDARHLWPAWFSLIEERCPPVIFGEQVASKAGLEWLDIVQTDLENTGYATGAADLCAASVKAPHVRQRLYWLGHSDSQGLQGQGRLVGRHDPEGWKAQRRHCSATDFWSDVDRVNCWSRKIRPIKSGSFGVVNGVSGTVGRLRGFGNAIVPQVAAEFIQAFEEARAA